MNARRPLRLAFGTLFGLVWCWSVLRIAAEPGQVGPVEEGIAAGGWTLSVLPVQATPWRRRRGLSRRSPTSRESADPLNHVRVDDSNEPASVPLTCVPAGPGADGGDAPADRPDALPTMPPPRRPAFGVVRPVVRPRLPAGATAVSALPALGCRPGHRPIGGEGPR